MFFIFTVNRAEQVLYRCVIMQNRGAFTVTIQQYLAKDCTGFNIQWQCYIKLSIVSPNVKG